MRSSSTADMYSCSEYGNARITCEVKEAFNLPYAAAGRLNSAASRAPYFLGATVLLEDPAGHVSELPTFSGVISLQAMYWRRWGTCSRSELRSALECP